MNPQYDKKRYNYGLGYRMLHVKGSHAGDSTLAYLHYSLSCMLNIPYPKITESNLNRYDTQMILKLYADKLISIHDSVSVCSLISMRGIHT